MTCILSEISSLFFEWTVEMRWCWHSFVAEIQLLKTKFYKETNSADAFLRSIRRSCETLISSNTSCFEGKGCKTEGILILPRSQNTIHCQNSTILKKSKVRIDFSKDSALFVSLKSLVWGAVFLLPKGVKIAAFPLFIKKTKTIFRTVCR